MRRGSNRHSLQTVELSQRIQTAVQIVSKPPAPRNGRPIYRFSGKPAMRSRWMTGAAPHESGGDVETNPSPTTSHKRVWICDICYKQIPVRKQISIRCNRIELWVHLRCAGIRQEQYTDTWTCHLHRESRLTSHTDTPPLQTGPIPHPLPTYTTATHTQTQVQHSPCSHRIGKAKT